MTLVADLDDENPLVAAGVEPATLLAQAEGVQMNWLRTITAMEESDVTVEVTEYRDGNDYDTQIISDLAALNLGIARLDLLRGHEALADISAAGNDHTLHLFLL